MHFDRSAFRLFLLFLGIEIAIALWVRDRFVRPYLGDVLVIFLLFYGLKSVLRQTTAVIATAVLFFAFCIEYLQFVKAIEWLGLSHNRIAQTILGTSYSIHDLLCYGLGFLALFPLENLRKKQSHSA